MCSNQSWENLVQRKATEWSLPWVVLPDKFEKMSVRTLICHWRIMIAGTFKSCKVFETDLQFSEWHKMCWFSITREKVKELPLRYPNPNYIWREKKNQNQYCGNRVWQQGSVSIYIVGMYKQQFQGSAKKATGQRITISILGKPAHLCWI